MKLVPCCISKLSGKKRKKKKSTQSSELIGNQIASKGRKGFLPKELKYIFFYLNPNYQFHRYGVAESPNSIINVLNKAFKVKNIRDSLLDYNLELSKQENYDMTVEQIKEDIESDNYLDPKRYIRLLEKMYNCQLYIFSLTKAVTRHDKKKEIPRLSVPRHKYGTNYYKYNTDKNVVIIFEHFGNDENRKYPHCELIFRTDYDNYNTTYHFKNSDKISINLKKLFNLYNLSYSLNIKIISQPLITFQNVKYQILDCYGKCRGIILKKDITILFDPIAPLNYPVKKDFPIPNYDELQKFLKDSVYNITELNIVNNQILGINCKYNNNSIFFPCNPKSVETKGKSQLIYFKGGNYLNEFILKKKIAKYLFQYVLYLYYKSEVDFNIFMKDFFIIKKDHQYNPSISSQFQKNSSYISGGKIIVTSKELKERIKYLLFVELQRNPNKIKNYKYMKNYYEDVNDFKRYGNQVILVGDIIRNFEYKFEYKLRKEVTDNIIPYFMLDKEIFLYQNSYSELGKDEIERDWDGGKGYNNFLIAKDQQKYLSGERDGRLFAEIKIEDKAIPKYVSKLRL